MTSVKRSLAFSFVDRYANVVIQLASTMVLARLLTPAEIGMFSLALSFVTIAHALRDFGVTNYLISESDLSMDKIRAALGLTLAIAWGIGILLLLASGPIADFFGKAQLQELLILVGATFFLIPFSSVNHALLRRDMRFGPLMVVHTASALSQASISILLALKGYGAVSLAWGSLGATVTTLIITNLYRPEMLGLMPRFHKAPGLLSFAKQMTGATLLAEIGEAAPDMIVSRLLGFTANGLFSKAKSLVDLFANLFMHAIWPVALPAFSGLRREGKSLIAPHEHALVLVTAVAWPFFGFVLHTADLVILVLLGDQWTGAVPIAEILCLAAALQILNKFVTPALIASGHVRYHFLIQLIFRPTAILVMVLGAFGGLESFVHSLILVAILDLTVSYVIAHRALRFNLLSVVSAVRLSLLLTIASCGPLWLLDSVVPELGPPLVNLMVLSLLFTVCWLSFLFLLRHPLSKELILLFDRLTSPHRERSETTQQRSPLQSNRSRED